MPALWAALYSCSLGFGPVPVCLFGVSCLHGILSLSFSGGFSVDCSAAGAGLLRLCLTDPWRIACREGVGRHQFNKFACCSSNSADRRLEWCCLLLTGRGGKGKKLCCCSAPRSVELAWSWCALLFKRGVGRRWRCTSGRLPWLEQKQEMLEVNSIIKRCSLFFKQGEWWVLPSLAGRGGEGRRSTCSVFALWRRFLLHLRASHAVVFFATAIFCHFGGLSSTSMAEAPFDLLRRCSTSLLLQVVRPRRRSDGRRQWIIAGMGAQASRTAPELGGANGAALSSLTRGRGGFRGPVCILSFSLRVPFAILKILFYKLGPLCNRSQGVSM